MTDQEKREHAKQFYNKWKGHGKEDEDGSSYWIDFLEIVLGVTHVTDRLEFEKKVVGPDGNTKKIDCYIPETKVLIEQKSFGIALDKPQSRHNGMTPYDQAKMYDNSLPVSEKSRYIVLSNFSEIWVYDMDARVPILNKFTLEDLQTKYATFDFLIDKQQLFVSNKEMEISVKAGEFVGLIYDALLKRYKDPSNENSLKSLNMLCVRLVFCLYAEDAHIFGDNGHMFHDYMAQYDATHMHKALIELFKTLDTKEEDRDPYDESDLSRFPYVNGGLFSDENIEVPSFTDEIRDILLTQASEGFDWSQISPTIFGAVFESTLNSETRRSSGMHYTSVENIRKVINPLFYTELKEEYQKISKLKVQKSKKAKLINFQNKLASLKWLDPACGSGNFLTQTYIDIRRLENLVIRDILDCDRKQVDGQMIFGDVINPIKVKIDQFYGIEINDFAVTVAKTALWIAESQMMKETEDILSMHLDFLPLHTNANIHKANAISVDWEKIIPKTSLNYIMGNPPFVGARWMSKAQKNDVLSTFGANWKNVGDLDYVCCWYKLATDYMKDSNVKAALVSTNSITQGVGVSNLWKPLFEQGIHIDFAYRTFIWDSEASIKAQVHCVIIGFSHLNNNNKKTIYDNGHKIEATNINGYLLDADNVFIQTSTKPISPVPSISLGGQAIDDGNLILSEEEKIELLSKEPQAEKYIRPYMMGKDFIERHPRYCLWLVDADPESLKQCPIILRKIEKVKKFRLASTRANTLRAADTPFLFATVLELKSNYIAIPKVSSQNRSYIPMDYLSPDIIPGDKLFTMPNSTEYEFGILMSNVHMAWTRAICGRLKSDLSYSNTLVYNNFPWPSPSNAEKKKIALTAKGILEARALYPKSSLSALYDPSTMPPELKKAHKENDKAVMQAYGFFKNDDDGKKEYLNESEIVTELIKMYQKLSGKSSQIKKSL